MKNQSINEITLRAMHPDIRMTEQKNPGAVPPAPDSSSAEMVARHLDWRRAPEKSIPTPTETFSTEALDEEDANDLVLQVNEGTLLVYGDIDLHQAPLFRVRGEQYIRESEHPRIDISGVPFLDSAGLATLLTLARQSKAQGKSLRLVATGNPRRVLRITGIDQVIVVED